MSVQEKQCDWLKRQHKKMAHGALVPSGLVEGHQHEESLRSKPSTNHSGAVINATTYVSGHIAVGGDFPEGLGASVSGSFNPFGGGTGHLRLRHEGGWKPLRHLHKRPCSRQRHR